MPGSRDAKAWRAGRWVVALALILAGCAAPPRPDRGAGLPAAAAAHYAEPPEFAGLLAEHGRWRRLVGTPDLVWSEAAAQRAQAWADHLAADKDCKPEHSSAESRGGAWGENIFSYWRGGDYEGFRRTPAEVVDAWGAESQWYVHDSNRCTAPAGQSCGHYTQVVSTTSSHVGCGRARCAHAEIWVCNYAPPGNFEGVPPY